MTVFLVVIRMSHLQGYTQPEVTRETFPSYSLNNKGRWNIPLLLHKVELTTQVNSLNLQQSLPWTQNRNQDMWRPWPWLEASTSHIKLVPTVTILVYSTNPHNSWGTKIIDEAYLFSFCWSYCTLNCTLNLFLLVCTLNLLSVLTPLKR